MTCHLYLPTRTHYAWVSLLQIVNINLTPTGQFLTPDSQIRTTIPYPIVINDATGCVWILQTVSERILGYLSQSFGNLWQCSEIVGSSSEIFGHLRYSSEIVRTSSEIQVLWRRKSHALDSGKVGRYSHLACPTLLSFIKFSLNWHENSFSCWSLFCVWANVSVCKY